LVDEHAFGGLPSDSSIFVRQGYILSYDAARRVPRWVAYHVKPDYRKTPSRKGAFKKFRTDPDVSNPVKDSDYVGLFGSAQNYARGHLAPYAVMGGDRDGDGLLAADGDEDDKLTVFESNYMSNIAPQNHFNFNGSGGLWFKLERWLQDDVVEEGGHEVWVFAGCIFGEGEAEKVGPNTDIALPPMFYKIVVRQEQNEDVPRILAFLFPHQRSKHGDIEDFLVPVDVIESLTGLDFLSDLEDDIETWLEAQDTWDFWPGFLGD
jgi:endonuclease G